MSSVQKTYLGKAVEFPRRMKRCAPLIEAAGVQWMETPHVSGASLSEPSPRLLSDTHWETLYLLLS
jgi:hypothetical protein